MKQFVLIVMFVLPVVLVHAQVVTKDDSTAKQLEEVFLKCDWIESSLPVETNILVVILKDETARDSTIQKLAELGVKVSAFGPGMIRLVTHLDVSPDEVEFTIEQLKKL